MGRDLPQGILDGEREEWGKEPNRFCLYLQYLDSASIFELLTYLSGKDYGDFMHFYSENEGNVDETLVIENLKNFMDRTRLKRFVGKKEEIEAWVLTMTRLLFDAIFKFLYGKRIEPGVGIFDNEEFDKIIEKIFGKKSKFRTMTPGHQVIYALNYAYRFNQFYGITSNVNWEGNYTICILNDDFELDYIEVKKIENEDGEYYEVIPPQ